MKKYQNYVFLLILLENSQLRTEKRSVTNQILTDFEFFFSFELTITFFKIKNGTRKYLKTPPF